jgi:hypothetical protein
MNAGTAESRLTTVAEVRRLQQKHFPRTPSWEQSPDAPGVLWRGVPAVSGEPRQRLQRTWIQSRLQYDDVDRRLMDTFPASDAVARY